MIYATRGLLDVLCDFAAEADPESVTAALAVTPAREIEGLPGLDPETPVFTDFYMPEVSESVRAVFGVDLATPAGQTQGRFVSHPLGRQELLRSDDLHEVVFVGVPPWESDEIAAYERSGRRRSLRVLDVAPPEETLAD